jgi:uncharacterized protein YjbI with pentapeptide repeats
MGASGESPVSSAGGQRHPKDDRKRISEEDNIRSQIRASWAQVAGSTVSALAVIVAIVVALQGQATVNHNSQTSLQQSEDTQLSTAITALGSSETAERVAGLQLLARNTAGRFSIAAETGEPAANVYDDYTTALAIFSGYMNSHGSALLTAASTGRAAPLFGHGYGTPPRPGVPLDLTYAADQVAFMVSAEMQKNVIGLNAGRPAIDLANDELYGQPWSGINFRWIWAYMVGIDLRGAILESSYWSRRSDLAHSYFQCADLQGAVFRGANLTYADLRGANVQGADFRGAKIRGAQLTQLYGTAKWSWRPRRMTILPVKEWNQGACLQDSTIWDPPTSASTSASPRPSSSPTPKPSPSKGK